MSIITKLLGSEVQGIFSDLTKFVGGLVTTKEEKAQIIERMEKAHQDVQLKLQNHLSDRHKVDMMSDSWLSKNIRPLFLVVMIVAFFVMAMSDGNLGQFEIDESYRKILLEWGSTAVMFYFGFRGVEKIATSTDLTDKLFNRKKRKDKLRNNEQ